MTIKLNVEGTDFVFSITKKGYDDCGYYWTDASISVSNRCFNYKIYPDFLEWSELINLNEKMQSLLMGKLHLKKKIEFIEPYLQIMINPKAKEMKLLFFPLIDNCITEQYYSLSLDIKEVALFSDFLTDVIEKLG